MKIGDFLRQWEIEVTDDPIPEFHHVPQIALKALVGMARLAWEQARSAPADFTDPYDARWCGVCGHLTDDGKACRRDGCPRAEMRRIAIELGVETA